MERYEMASIKGTHTSVDRAEPEAINGSEPYVHNQDGQTGEQSVKVSYFWLYEFCIKSLIWLN